MKLVFTITILLLILGSCGKKSDPKYQGSKIYYTKIIN